MAPRANPQAARPGEPYEFRPDREFDAIVEVIDLRSGKLIAENRHDTYMSGQLWGGRMFTVRIDDSGDSFIDIWEFTLE